MEYGSDKKSGSVTEIKGFALLSSLRVEVDVNKKRTLPNNI